LSKDTIHRNALSPGHRLHWYVIEGVLGQGGFGITYLADDTNLDRKVAIKEFLPVELAVRTDTGSVVAASSTREQAYSWGLERFISEARTLAKFNHRAIVRVHSVFEANNTAYMVMDYVEGETLKSLLMREKTLGEGDLRHILAPILDGLDLVHASGFIHRDIKPSNVFLRRDGSAVLMDFGSARQALGPRTTTLTNMVSPGYAPFEQYMTDGERQGPWTDIYGAGATLYRAVTGHSPLDAIRRSEGILREGKDAMVPAAHAARGRYSRRFLAAVDHALAFNVDQRPASVELWRQEFGLEALRDKATPAVSPFKVTPAIAAPGLAAPRRGAGNVVDTSFNPRGAGAAVLDDMPDTNISARYTGTAGVTEQALTEALTARGEAAWSPWRPMVAIAALLLGVLGVAKWPDHQAFDANAAVAQTASLERTLQAMAVSPRGVSDPPNAVFSQLDIPAESPTGSFAASGLPETVSPGEAAKPNELAGADPASALLDVLAAPNPSAFESATAAAQLSVSGEPAAGPLLALISGPQADIQSTGFSEPEPEAEASDAVADVSKPRSAESAPPPRMLKPAPAKRELRARQPPKLLAKPERPPRQRQAAEQTPGSGPEAPSVARFQQQRLNRLFVRAQEAEREGRYTNPRWDNAASFYREILTVDRGNARARAGLRRAESASSRGIHRRPPMVSWSTQTDTAPRGYRTLQREAGRQGPSGYREDGVGEIVTGTVQGVASGVRRFGRTLGRIFQ
jgi:serine/threonine protein kinase